MNKKILLLLFTLILFIAFIRITFKVQIVEAGSTIIIHYDGSITGTDKIHRFLNYYTFLDNINDSIVIERSYIVVDGANYAVQGKGSGIGINLQFRSCVTLKNLVVTNFRGGIKLSNSHNNILTNNTVTNNFDYGIDLFSSVNNVISETQITNNSKYATGIGIDYSSYNEILNNTIRYNCVGIGCLRSTENVFRNNTIGNCEGNLVFYGKELAHYINDIDASNTVNGKPVYYWVQQSNRNIPPDAGYVALVECTNITVRNLELMSNAPGLLLVNTDYSVIADNVIVNITMVHLNYGIVHTIRYVEIT